MEYGNAALLNQFSFYINTSGRADVFQIDSAKGRSQFLNNIHNFIRICGVQTDRPGIQPGKLFHQKRLALHNRKPGCSTDVSQTEHCRPVCYDGYGVSLPGITVGIFRIFLNFQARLRNPRRIGQ